MSFPKMWHFDVSDGPVHSLLLSLETPNAVRYVAYSHKIFMLLTQALIRLRINVGWSERLMIAITKALIRMRVCAGWSEPVLVARTLCWKSHVAAHLMNRILLM